MNSTSPNFVETLEHRRFAEFCDACSRYRYIGLCYGRPGVGKTLSARRSSRWDCFESIDPNPCAIPDEALAALIGVKTIYYTTPVVNTPRQINDDISRLRSQLRSLAKEPLRRRAARKLKEINIRDNRHGEEMFTTHDWLSEPMPKLKPTYATISRKYAAKEKHIGDPTQLILVDEADRLKIASLEQKRAVFDAGDFGFVLIGMPGLEKRLARYPQFYSRIGFVHEFRPLNAPEMRRLLAHGWVPAGVTLPAISALDPETAAAIIRVTGGNFRLLDRLLTQMERIVRINDLADLLRTYTLTVTIEVEHLAMWERIKRREDLRAEFIHRGIGFPDFVAPVYPVQLRPEILPGREPGQGVRCQIKCDWP